MQRGTSYIGTLVGYPGTVQARMEIFGTTRQLPLSTVAAFLGKPVAMARRTL